jgi:DMSO/TMAO reductase YedYZ molybdopterin-dependent catalytic subunit
MEIPGSYKWRSKSPGDGGQRLLTRRFLMGFALASFGKAQKPEISSFDLSLLHEPVVPRDLFFVREHFPAPVVSSAGWKLSIRGAVAKPLVLSYDEISALPQKVLPVTLECAENAVGGGLVSHAEWTGVAFASLLDRAQPDSAAKFVRLSGADGFSRSLPISKAIHPDTLIAYQMNGEKLPPNHGFPLRAVIPGWYGMDSVKWLREVELSTEDDRTPAYVRVTRSLLAGNRPAGRITAMTVKSVFSRPADGAMLVSRRFIVRGAAWTGENRVERVEVSTDAGKVWSNARLESNSLPYSWRLWAFDWRIPTAGEYELIVRAIDDQGHQQPATRPAERVDPYELNSYQSVRVTVV